MSDTCHHEAIFTAFSSRRIAHRARAVRDAYIDDHADPLLAQMLDESNDLAFGKVVIAAHLGDLTGAAGDDALRRAIRVSGPGSRDLRCASLLALAKRVGTQATPDLLAGLAASDAAVKRYAVIGLAGTGGGDDNAWKQVFAYLRSVLRRKRRAHGQSEVALALAYLAQHVADPSRRFELVAFIRGNWDALDEADWFAQLWSDASPGGPDLDAVPSPNHAAIQAWAREPLFRPLGVPTA
ncbi:MAG: hypothetical protein L0H59_12290 [Tomitella sp.]|uniref:hypothetical protein n=1 Tax=Intrasporangium sp. TaxID=1925024 RepID=UPI0026479F51|nr:hypothetical protein [Intrasporangium sp.]MDN5759290.1 hypothetical protein [Tomitella sp.]MDN5797108.1 hypothetical protein [Intrasporangium sp.]